MTAGGCSIFRQRVFTGDAPLFISYINPKIQVFIVLLKNSGSHEQ